MKRLVSGFILSIAAIISTNSFAVTTCPSYQFGALVTGSFPCFETAVQFKLRQAHDSVPLSVNGIYDRGGISNFNTPTASLAITDTNFRFNAAVGGPVQNPWIGNMTIMGHMNLPGLSSGAPQVLMSADLTGVYAQSGSLIGFNTINIDCNAAIDAYLGGGGCTTNEVIYFALNGPVNLTGGKNQNLVGTAYTSVPLPAAVWLFGSGLLGLMGITRGRKIAA